MINDVGQELKEALATEYFYVTDTDGEILDDCCRTPKDGLIDLYIGGGLFLTESDAKIFITSECVDVVVKSISRIDFDNLEVEHIIKEGISKAETPIAEKQNIELPQGIRVSHERFGMGVIIEELQDGENAKLKIVFENSGEKLLLKKFCQLTYLND